MSPLRCAIAGMRGRMGRALLQAAADHEGIAIAAGTEQADRLDAAAAGPPVFGMPEGAAALAEVWIDFTTPEATLAALAVLPESGVRAAVIGTTGFNPEQERAIAAAAEGLAIVKAGNFSLGVAVLSALVRRAAAALGPDWDIEITEAHHRHKRDAPSGTALRLGEAAAAGRGAPLSSLALPPRERQNAPRPHGGIGFAVVRGGGVIGRHDVLFASATEAITLRHEALDRSVFAHGALAAALWAGAQPPGLYAIEDVLGLRAE